MLRIDREVAWLRLGSCTDHVISAAAATPDRLSNPSPALSRKRRAHASRIDADNWPTKGMTRSIAGMLMGPRGDRAFAPAGATLRLWFHCPAPARGEYSRRRDCCRRPAAAPDN